jgi:cytochrome b561
MTTSTKYTKTAIFLHWLVALLLIANVVLGWTAEIFPEERIRLAIDTHKSLGITVLGLVLLRILWRMGHPPPALPHAFGRTERVLATLGHVGLYALMLGIPLSGWMHDSAWKDAATHPMQLFYTVPWPRIGLITELQAPFKEQLHDLFGLVHTYLNWGLVALFAIHLGAVLKHHLQDSEPVLDRMLP